MIKFFLFLILFFSSFFSVAGWSQKMGLKEVYFEGLNNDQKMVVVFDSSFHDCGWNTTVNLNKSLLGENVFNTYASVILGAWHTNTEIAISVNTSSRSNKCDGDRAKGIAIKLAK
ncbi:hypothetical protein [Pseudoalteromonas luteoviolacea]|uniref:Uncharacterized protein n=1 Tax=Pseudoalteromonas luteoviolacea H33 TaxID=1365251 RepID=A0A167DZB0_9GAMM|nr:hypothetical protein [Pseudoalteromonas luteoviolacea]KZN49788.1 hypothetical protein N476_18520 [Pseudoalteromonas luteoviolacea H33]KZN77812.1 hypothetical protein N477_00975 [Pseudoalteromonas luteoviolacea H33-S]